MEALNPLRSVQGRGDPRLRAYIVSYLSKHPEGVTAKEVAAAVDGSKVRVKEILNEAVAEGVLDEDYAVVDPPMIAGIPVAVKRKYAKFIHKEMNVSHLESQYIAEDVLIQTGWITSDPDDYTTFELSGSPKNAVKLVNALAGEKRISLRRHTSRP